MNGFIFINSEGEYAVERPNSGFGSATQVIRWTKNINDATVFSNSQPWTGIMDKHCNELKCAQPLQATVSRIVTLGVWKKETNNG